MEAVAHQLRGDGAGAVIQRAGRGLGLGDQLLHRLRPGLAGHRQHRHGLGRGGDRREIVDRIVGQRLVEVLVHHQRGVDRHQQRVAVRRGFRHLLRPDHGVAAGPVVDDHRLAPVLVHPLRQQPCGDIGRSAGRERHDDVDRAMGIVFRSILRGRGRERPTAQRGAQRGNPGSDPKHGDPPVKRGAVSRVLDRELSSNFPWLWSLCRGSVRGR